MVIEQPRHGVIFPVHEFVLIVVIFWVEEIVIREVVRLWVIRMECRPLHRPAVGIRLTWRHCERLAAPRLQPRCA